jgi:hypothetical protein
MYQFGYLHCSTCQGVRRLGSVRIVEGLPELGNAVKCAACSRSALMLVERRGIFCANCDSICPARIEPSPVSGASIVCCGHCGFAVARLHAADAQGATSGVD